MVKTNKKARNRVFFMMLVLKFLLTLKYTYVFNCQAKNSNHPINIFNKKNQKFISPLKNKIYKFKLKKDESIQFQIKNDGRTKLQFSKSTH